MWLALLAILALCTADHVYFTEGRGAQSLSDGVRKVAHISILAAIIPVGYLGWRRHPQQWLKRVWLWSHLCALSAVVLAGAACYSLGYYDKALLKKLGDIRLFFCSPVPYLVLYLLSLISGNLGVAPQKEDPAA